MWMSIRRKKIIHVIPVSLVYVMLLATFIQYEALHFTKSYFTL